MRQLADTRRLHGGALRRPAVGLLLALLVTLLASLSAVGAAHGAPVIDVEPSGVHVADDPALDGPWAVAAPAPSAARPAPARVTRRALAARKRRRDPVRSTILRAEAQGTLDAATATRYLSSWSAGLRAYGRLSGQRRAELGYVLATARRLAQRRQLAARLVPVFLLVDRNREWWSKAGPPASGARLRFGSSRVIFQYFPGEGLQLHPLANFGQANGYWYAHRDSDLRSLLQDMIGLGVKRGGFLAWEYYFGFDGGSPPWISGMAQGTAMQALARASQRLGDPALLAAAKEARGAFERGTPVGVHARDGSRDWYPLYSFAPRLNVLNGMLQAVNGIRTYNEVAQDPAAQRLFEAGDSTARAVISAYDTGAWSLYSRPGDRPGPEASLNYHTLNRDFSRNLCKATKASAYCDAADHFAAYLKEDPVLDPYRAVPSPAKAGKGVRFRFRLSKVGRVGIVVRDTGPSGAPGSATGARTAAAPVVLSTSAPFSHGEHWFRWIPPRRVREHTYEYTLYARDLAGNSSSVQGELRVKPSKGKPR